MGSFCCPLCTFISVACLFSSFCSGCGYRRYRCSTWRGVSGSGSSPRFRCCGKTGMATSAAAASTSEAQQNQPETKNQSRGISASAAPKTESAATLQPLLQEVVAKDEPDEEAFALQRALAESLVERSVDSSEPGPQQDLQPRSEQEKVAQVAQSMDQIGKEENGSDVAAGFVEVMYDGDQ